MFRLTEVQSLI